MGLANLVAPRRLAVGAALGLALAATAPAHAAPGNPDASPTDPSPTRTEIGVGLRADLKTIKRAIRRVGFRRLGRRRGLTITGLDALWAGTYRLKITTGSGKAARRILVGRGKKTVSKAGPAKLRLRFTKAGRRIMRERRRVRIKHVLSFTEIGGGPVTVSGAAHR